MFKVIGFLGYRAIVLSFFGFIGLVLSWYMSGSPSLENFLETKDWGLVAISVVTGNILVYFFIFLFDKFIYNKEKRRVFFSYTPRLINNEIAWFQYVQTGILGSSPRVGLSGNYKEEIVDKAYYEKWLIQHSDYLDFCRRIKEPYKYLIFFKKILKNDFFFLVILIAGNVLFSLLATSVFLDSTMNDLRYWEDSSLIFQLIALVEVIIFGILTFLNNKKAERYLSEARKFSR